jgi:hypothetical protein
MRTDLSPAAELAAAADDLREFADSGEAAGLIPHWDAEARRTGAAILDDWRRVAGGEGS